MPAVPNRIPAPFLEFLRKTRRPGKFAACCRFIRENPGDHLAEEIAQRLGIFLMRQTDKLLRAVRIQVVRDPHILTLPHGLRSNGKYMPRVRQGQVQLKM